MHTADSTPTEVALSKLGAAIAVIRQAEDELRSGNLVDADERIDKAGGKLLGASVAVAEALRGDG